MSGDVSLEKSMPCSLDGERAVLGAVLLDEKLIHTAAELLKPEDFYLESHRIIYRRMLDLVESTGHIGLITLKAELQRRDELERAGGIAYVASLTDSAGLAVRHYCELVRERAVLRRMIQLANDLQTQCYEGEMTARQVLDETSGKLLALHWEQAGKGFVRWPMLRRPATRNSRRGPSAEPALPGSTRASRN